MYSEMDVRADYPPHGYPYLIEVGPSYYIEISKISYQKCGCFQGLEFHF